MDLKKEKKYFNTGLSLAAIVLLFTILGTGFTFYYDLNDDVLIKDIIAGVYSGKPSAHTNQLLYPIAWFISIFYRLFPTLPWYGLALCGCQGICFYLIMRRSLCFVKDKIQKIFLLSIELVFILALCMWELVVVQYTVTSALLAATACFLVFTQQKKEQEIIMQCADEKDKQSIWKEAATFVWKNKIAVVLVILAFNIRSEMLLLMSPFIALTGIIKWSDEESVLEKKTVAKYGCLIGTILIGVVLSIGIDSLAYSGKDWKDFRNFFDARTRVYDYTWYPSYDEARDFYQDIAASKVQVMLIDNYNFGLDEAIDSDMLWEIAEYAESTGVKEPLFTRIKAAVMEYKWRIFHEQDAPYNYIVLAAYGLAVLVSVWHKDKSAFWKLPLMGVFRTIPWMYVILSKRVPVRISHPLYFIELIILCAWMLQYCRKVWMGRVCAIVLGVAALCILPSSVKNLSEEMQRRETVNAVMQDFDAYAGKNSDKYFYMDVYSTVDFSEKMFQNVDNSQKNYDILGGWFSGSPLQKQAADSFHKDRLSRAELLLQENFYFVMEADGNVCFLEDFYGTQGITIHIRQVEEITANERTLLVYEVLQEGM